MPLHTDTAPLARFTPVPPPRPPRPPRRRLVLGTLALVVAGAALGTTLALVTSHPAARRTPTTPATPAGSPGAVLHPAAITVYDPQGDGTGHSDTVPLAADGNPGTAWETEHYASAAFGNLKSGTGLLVDLGGAHRVTSLTLRLTSAGAGVELRAGDAPSSDPATFHVVARAAQAPEQLTLRPRSATTARYWVIWFTSLPPGSGGYRAGIAEMTFRG